MNNIAMPHIAMKSVIDCKISASLNVKVIFSFSKVLYDFNREFCRYLRLYWLNTLRCFQTNEDFIVLWFWCNKRK